MKRLAVAIAVLFFVGTAHAEKPHGDPHAPTHETHGAANAHGENAHGDQKHSAAGHHYEYTADEDGDGTPNWLDTTTGNEKNEHFPLWGVLYHAINLLLFIGVLFWFGRRPIGDALANRALLIRKELSEGARLRDEAQKRNEELSARLDKISFEIATLRKQAEEDAAREEQKLIERAHSEAARIQAASERAIRDETQRARHALKRDATLLAIELAEDTLKNRMTGEHQNQLAREFLDSLTADGANRV